MVKTQKKSRLIEMAKPTFSKKFKLFTSKKLNLKKRLIKTCLEHNSVRLGDMDYK